MSAAADPKAADGGGPDADEPGAGAVSVSVTVRPPALRSSAWFGAPDRQGFVHRTHLHQLGIPGDSFDGTRPVVAIANTWSELNPCNSGLRTIAESVKRGVWEGGGVPFEMPVMSLGEPYMRPTTMLYRNQLAMEVEELLRANPVDAVVLLGGCDKTVPGLLMGAVSADLPAVVVTTGPMLDGLVCGEPVGSGTDVWRLTEAARAGELDAFDLATAEAGMSRSPGHCMTMGTASTMACLTEALGMTLSGGAAIPATDSRRLALGHHAGRLAVGLVAVDRRPTSVLTAAAFRNAVVVNAAIGGSTNAVLHLLALAGRAGVPLTLDDIDRLGRDVPLLVDLKPSGRFLMGDFFAAGGLGAVIAELLGAGLLDGSAPTVAGPTLAELYTAAPNWNRDVIATVADPVQTSSPTVVLRGNIAPAGAVIKTSAATPALLRHRGPAKVFDSIETYLAAAEDPSLDVTADTVIVVRNLGPIGYPGMPELGNLPIPVVLVAKGVTDMVRISDTRMSGTAYGTVVLHVAPEAAAGGPLGLLRDGDVVELDAAAGRLHAELTDAELERRRADWSPPPVDPAEARGWTWLYRRHVMQADTGCDLDFLVGRSGAAVPKRAF